MKGTNVKNMDLCINMDSRTWLNGKETSSTSAVPQLMIPHDLMKMMKPQGMMGNRFFFLMSDETTCLIELKIDTLPLKSSLSLLAREFEILALVWKSICPHPRFFLVCLLTMLTCFWFPNKFSIKEKKEAQYTDVKWSGDLLTI